MSTWTNEDLRTLTAPDEVRIATRRRDGTARPSRIIWIVAVGDRAFVRSTNGRDAAWFRGVLNTLSGEIDSGGTTYPVTFAEAGADDQDAVSRAYREKYGRYAAIVDHLDEPGPRAATVEVRPA